MGRRDVQIFYIGVNYRFGRSIKQTKEEKLQSDAEQ